MQKKRIYIEGRNDVQDILDIVENSENRALLKTFFDGRISNGNDFQSSKGMLYVLKNVSNSIGCPFKESTQDKINDFLKKHDTSEYRRLIKYFYKNLVKKPELTDHITLKFSIREIKNKRERFALTQAEIIKLIDNCDNQRDRTIITLMTEYPLRSKDVIGIKYKDVTADEYGFKVKVFSKTKAGKRELRLINTVPEMQLYLKNYPFKNNPEAPLFFQQSFNKYGQACRTWSVIGRMLEKVSKRAGFKRKIVPHDLRHSTATSLLKDSRFSVSEIKLLGGWADLKTLQKYSHLTDKDVGEKILNLNGKKKEEVIKEDLLKPKNCPRCNNLCSATDHFCLNCHQVLDIEEAQKLKDEQEDLKKKIELFNKLFTENKEVFEKMLK